MTWGELKQKVEAEGITDDDEVDYLDVSPGYSLSIDPKNIVIMIEEHADGRWFSVQ